MMSSSFQGVGSLWHHLPGQNVVESRERFRFFVLLSHKIAGQTPGTLPSS